MFKQVLKIDPKNIWAANGIGAVLGEKFGEIFVGWYVLHHFYTFSSQGGS